MPGVWEPRDGWKSTRIIRTTKSQGAVAWGRQTAGCEDMLAPLFDGNVPVQSSSDVNFVPPRLELGAEI